MSFTPEESLLVVSWLAIAPHVESLSPAALKSALLLLLVKQLLKFFLGWQHLSSLLSSTLATMAADNSWAFFKLMAF